LYVSARGEFLSPSLHAENEFHKEKAKQHPMRMRSSFSKETSPCLLVGWRVGFATNNIGNARRIFHNERQRTGANVVRFGTCAVEEIPPPAFDPMQSEVVAMVFFRVAGRRSTLIIVRDEVVAKNTNISHRQRQAAAERRVTGRRGVAD
jgi:hypothetical protein